MPGIGTGSATAAGARAGTARRTGSRAAFGVALVVWLVVAALAGVGIWLGSWFGDSSNGLVVLFSLVLPTVGVLIVRRQQGNRIGWLLLGCAVCLTALAAAVNYTIVAFQEAPGALPAVPELAWLAFWIGAPAAALVVVLPLVFPDGRLLSRGWRPVLWLVSGGLAAMTALAAVSPGAHTNPKVTYLNPFAVAGAPRVGEPPAAYAFFGFLLVLMVPGVVSQVVRFRRAAGVERQQVKWFFYAAGLVPAALVVAMGVQFIPAARPFLDLIWALVWAGYPVAVGIAVLRYRLYDVDVVINRTLVYGVLSILLALTYSGGVLVLQWLLRPVTQGSELAVAGSTLLVAAAFQPLRRRIQEGVDRRFYRRKYDAVRTLGAFGARLRTHTDLDALRDDVLGVTRVAVQPRRAGLWLRRADGAEVAR